MSQSNQAFAVSTDDSVNNDNDNDTQCWEWFKFRDLQITI